MKTITVGSVIYGPASDEYKKAMAAAERTTYVPSKYVWWVALLLSLVFVSLQLLSFNRITELEQQYAALDSKNVNLLAAHTALITNYNAATVRANTAEQKLAAAAVRANTAEQKLEAALVPQPTISSAAQAQVVQPVVGAVSSAYNYVVTALGYGGK